MKDTKQQQFWKSKFGEEYSDRNTYKPEELDDFYKKTYGVSRTDMNKDFLENLEVNNILEVGCNIGNQLNLLQTQKFKNLYGLEIQWDAVERAKDFTKQINIIQGSAFDLPFRDNYFDLVFTSGVLIHINPKDLKDVMAEIYRTTKKYIWGFEYFAPKCEDIEYRGNKGYLWKNDFAKIYLDDFSDLKIIKRKKYKYIKDENLVDEMFLLKKYEKRN